MTTMSHLEPTEPPDPPTTPHEELAVLRNLVDLLEDLDASARSRLVAYLFDRYNDRSPW
jgi:hypothetical protein